MLNPEKLFTGPAFKPGVGGASTPPLDALQSSVDDHLGMDSELTCEFKISIDPVELSFTDKEICHHDSKVTVIQLEPDEALLSEKQKVCSRKTMPWFDMTTKYC